MLPAHYRTRNYRMTQEKTILQVNYTTLIIKKSTKKLAQEQLILVKALWTSVLPIVISIKSKLIAHTTTQRTFINFRKSYQAVLKDDIEIQLKKYRRSTFSTT